jgi:hypothetical protein
MVQAELLYIQAVWSLRGLDTPRYRTCTNVNYKHLNEISVNFQYKYVHGNYWNKKQWEWHRFWLFEKSIFTLLHLIRTAYPGLTKSKTFCPIVSNIQTSSCTFRMSCPIFCKPAPKYVYLELSTVFCNTLFFAIASPVFYHHPIWIFSCSRKTFGQYPAQCSKILLHTTLLSGCFFCPCCSSVLQSFILRHLPVILSNCPTF